MSEETAVLTPPASEQGIDATSSLQDAKPTAQAAESLQPETPVKVETEQKPVSSSGEKQSRRPSAFWELRQENRTLSKKLAELEQKITSGQSQAQDPAAPKKESPFKFNSDDDIYKAGLAPSLNQVLEYNQKLQERIDALEKGMPTYFENYQKQQEETKLEQEIAERISKYKEQGLEEKVAEILEKKPILNSVSKLGYRETLDALNEIDEMMKSETEKANKDPLAPKKSRMGISGSGNPIDGGNTKPDLNSLRERKARLQEQFAEKRKDPEYMKEWNKVNAALVTLAKEQAGS